MHRRTLLLAGACGACIPALGRAAPAGTLSRPLFLHGPVTIIIWSDPQPHLEMLHRPAARAALRNLERLAARAGAPDEAVRLLAAAIVPPSAGGERWRVELPTLAQLQVADVPRPKIGGTFDVLGTWTSPVTGTPTVTARVLFFEGRAYVLPPATS
ncbi:hypothetical protein H8N03_14030 [Ramlibacter sp. USB13]|uniref:Uncharacterized protein n=1 Tax=Ramlibacter cellulosilyticus TaxID=2764187 RepID=A0A923MSE0_9BURK|nr:hypothetical protein [Ramlibacter cellulosilyticus]MBC5784066.1 hypothetical protein [Ramlibacter cellulosilyticus]